MVLVHLGQEGYSVIRWVLGFHRLLKDPGKTTERSSEPTVVALNMLYRGPCHAEKVLGGPRIGKRLKITGAANGYIF